ncbi:MAG TPA: glycosyltransferase [Candidatus Acidoferrales bacterium]|nr:glycosyltransferase [Candidatus Acidoferrales bacterium]
MGPEISVVIPTYNRREMVREAIESVLRQTCRDFELIVVDDGSEDGTGALLARYGEKLRLCAQPHRGVAAARNRGVQESRGYYLAFLDSDDLWLPRKLEVQLAFMRENPSIEICQTEEIWYRNGVRVNPRVKHRKPSGDIFRASLELCLVSPSAVMMTRSLFESAGGFDESFPACEDYDLWLRIARFYPVALIAEPLVIKRGGHSDQLSRSLWGLDRFRARSLQKLLDAGLEGERREWVMEALRRKAAILSRGARKRGNEEAARAYEAVLESCAVSGAKWHDRF